MFFLFESFLGKRPQDHDGSDQVDRMCLRRVSVYLFTFFWQQITVGSRDI